MTLVSTVGLLEAVTETLDKISEFIQLQTGGEITEGIPETPMVQVYFEEFELLGTSTDRASFGSKSSPPIVRQQFLIHVDIYARQRSHIGQDLLACYTLMDLVIDELQKQRERPYFGHTAIDAFTYSAERVTFEYSQVQYIGVRLPLKLTVL